MGRDQDWVIQKWKGEYVVCLIQELKKKFNMTPG